MDFSVSCNPFGTPHGIREAVNQAPIDCYPDTETSKLKNLLAHKLKIAIQNIIVGSGSTELIRLLALAYLGSSNLALIPQPTYGEYEVACQIVGAKVLKQPTAKEMNFRLNTAETAKLIREHRPKAIFICNPNNPTGQYLPRKEIEYLMSSSDDCLLVLDEAYIAFTPNAWPSNDMIYHGNLVILRSMTKDYTLAGLRLGYALAAKPIISTLKKVRPPWNVATTAQAAGIAALNDDAYLDDCTIKIQQAKDYLITELESLGLSPLPSQTNFFLVEVGQAADFRRALLSHGIIVRDCTSFGLPQYIRLAPRTLPECERLITAIKRIGVQSHAS
jgi:histidinol-phosphate aminotransferase